MFSKELAELDRNTVQYMIDEMQKEGVVYASGTGSDVKFGKYRGKNCIDEY